MVLTTSLSESWRVFFPIDNKEQKLIMPLAVILKLYMEFHKGQFWVPYFLISISATYFFDIIECDIASYADDNTPYNFDFNLDNVISNLEKSTNSLLNWFRENHMKANADKCHLLVSSDERCTAKIEDFSIKNSTKEKLLGVKFDSNLSFETHVTSLCKKANQKLHACARISHYLDLNERRNLMKAFITSQFSYFPLIWMFHSRNLNNQINLIHERAPRLVYQNNLSFSELLDLANSVTVHQKNLQVLVTEIYKVKNGIALEIMKDIFELQNPSYNLRSSCRQFRRKHKNRSLWLAVSKIS